ncbi:hypothetical protein BC826DRAFT_1049111, partial [Russula brevipes]
MGKSGKTKGKKSKKNRRETRRANPPRFLYSNSEIIKRRDPVTINDIRDLVLHIIADSPPPSWIRVQNPRSIQKLVVLLVPGLTSTVLSLPPLPTSATENPNLPIAIPLPPDPPLPDSSPTDPPSSVDPRSEEAVALCGGIPFIARTFSHACPTRAPGDANRMHSVLNTFFQTPVSGEEKKRRLQGRIEAERTGQRDPSRYLLTVEQMIENDYPVPSYLADVFTKPDGWIETPQPATDTDSGAQSAYAIDCEMCLTADGKALTRVCIIDFATSKVVYDQLVKPPSPITDYLTRSGAGTYNHNACRCSSTSSHAPNTINDPARPLARVRFTRSATRTPAVHRHCVALPSPARAPTQAGAGVACAQVARPHHT